MESVRVSPVELEAVGKKRIVFGHQSVGDNILSGVQSLAHQAGIQLKVTERRGPAQEPGITHFRIGRNGEPQSKLKDFVDTLASGAVNGADVALMKLCYVDFKSDTDAKKIAREYCASLESLTRGFPNTIFLAVTAPLTEVQHGPKAWLKRLIDGGAAGYSDNFRRQEFNTIIRGRYGRQGRLFDLAKIEAEGSPVHSYEEVLLEVLNPRFTSDGGHLNALGAQIVAARLVGVIAALPEPSQR